MTAKPAPGDPAAAVTPAAPTLRPPLRPSGYGRNYSYFSHRVFVAFMPEDLHDYLHRLFEWVPGNDTARDDSDRIDVELVRWVLLHRSQLNALALNRLIESWRGPDNALRLPAHGALRSDAGFRTDITLQFAVELELANDEHRARVQNRPRLQMALLDAAYFISRQRSAQDTHRDQPATPGQARRADIDLSEEEGRKTFESYLFQRMNLHEDGNANADPARSGLAGAPLSKQEVDWLCGVAIAIARTLSSPADRATMRERWQLHCAAHWPAGVPVPGDRLYAALLTGPEDSPLQETQSGSVQYAWRMPPFPQNAWQTNLANIAARSDQDSGVVIDAVETALAQFSLSNEQGLQGHPLQLMSDRYGVLPTTPAWASVAAARENMRHAKAGLGATQSLLADSRLLQQYAGIIRQNKAARAVIAALEISATLAGLQSGAARLAPWTKQPAKTPASLPDAAAWNLALQTLCMGLRMSEGNLDTSCARLDKTSGELQSLMAAAGPEAAETAVAAATPHDAALPAPGAASRSPDSDWPDAPALNALLSAAFTRAIEMGKSARFHQFTTEAARREREHRPSVGRAAPLPHAAELVISLLQASPTPAA